MRLSKFSFLMLSSLVTGMIAVACGGGDDAEPTTAATATRPAGSTATAPTATAAVGTTPLPAATLPPATTGSILDSALDPAPYELENVKYGGSFKIVWGFSNPFLDPKYVIQINDMWPAAEKLVGWMPNEKDVYSHLEPIIAEGWKASTDLKTYTITIKKGVKWQNVAPLNGREFVADDAVFNINRYAEKDSIRIPVYSQIESTRAVDKYTVEIKIKEPTAWLMNDIFGGTEWMVAPELVNETADKRLQQKFIGTGPYILKDYRFRQGMTFERNPDYWRKDTKGRVVPYTDKVEWIFILDAATTVAGFRTGQLDTGPSLSGQGLAGLDAIAKTVPGMRLHATGLAPFVGLSFNTRKAPWNDVRVRRAMNMLIDKPKFASQLTSSSKLYYSTPLTWSDVSDQPFKEEDMGPYFKYNPTEAKKLLIEAGFADGKLKVASPMEYAANPGFTVYAQITNAMFKDGGVQLDLTSISTSEYFTKWYLQKHEDISLNFTNTGDYSLNWYAQNKYKIGATQNTSFISDPAIQQAVTDIKATSDPVKLRQLARTLWDHDTQGSYNIWVINEKAFSATSPHVRNYVARAAAGFAGLTFMPWLTDAPRTSP